MSKYENEAIGNIVIIKNVIFENPVTNKKESDHAWRRGRPCLIIYSDDEYDYFLTIKTEISDYYYESQYYKITEEDILYKNENRHNKAFAKVNRKMPFNGEVNLETVFKLPISGHDEIAKITPETYRDIIKEFEKYHQDKRLEELVETARQISR